MSWTDERVTTLKKLWLDGLSASQIAKQLGGVTRNAVIGKVHRLGLSGRAAPSQPARPAFKAPRPARPAATTMPSAPRRVIAAEPAALPAVAQQPSVPAFRAEEPGSATVLTLGAHMCKWPNGDVFTLSYASGRLKTVFSNRGYALVFDYDGAGNVSAACGFNRAVAYVTTSTTCTSAAIKTSYGYTSGRLTSATSVTGAVASYQYNGWGGALSCLTDPGTSTCKYTLEYTPGGNNEVIKQTLADGSVWTFSCSCVYARGVGEEFQDDGTGWIDPSGNGKSFFLTNGMIKAYWDENSKQYETYFYGGQLSGVLLPEKNRWFANLSPRGIVSSNVYRPSKTGVSGYPDIVQDAKTFPSGDCTNRVTCNKPLTIADGNGNLTSFTYDQTHGGVLTETRPANSANVAAVVRHAYVQRTAWVKNASGGYSAEPAIWLPSEDRTCKTTATTGTTCAGGAADEIVTTYEYGPDSGPNNLLLRGKAVTADGITLRVCYAYDAQGNRIAETNARAGLASCP